MLQAPRLQTQGHLKVAGVKIVLFPDAGSASSSVASSKLAATPAALAARWPAWLLPAAAYLSSVHRTFDPNGACKCTHGHVSLPYIPATDSVSMGLRGGWGV